MFLPLGDDVDTRTLPMVGLALIGINLLVFCWMIRMAADQAVLSGARTPSAAAGWTAAIEGFERTLQTRNVIFRYGLTSKDLQNDRFVGAVTHMFIHAGLMHLLGNMIVLWAFVGTLEHALGPWKLLACYLLWGVLAGLAEAGMHWGSDIPLVGASGAIAGVIGAYWVEFGYWTRIRTLVWIVRPRVYMIPAGVFVAIWVCFQLKGLFESSPYGGGVAWYAHLGGLLAGAGTMFVIRGRNARRLVQKWHGDVEFEESREHRDRDVAADHIAMPGVCPYCRTKLSTATSLAANLARCPNDSCGRLVLLETPRVVSTR